MDADLKLYKSEKCHLQEDADTVSFEHPEHQTPVGAKKTRYQHPGVASIRGGVRIRWRRGWLRFFTTRIHGWSNDADDVEDDPLQDHAKIYPNMLTIWKRSLKTSKLSMKAEFGTPFKFESMEDLAAAATHCGRGYYDGLDEAALFAAVRVAQNGAIGRVKAGSYVLGIPPGAVHPKGHPKAIAKNDYRVLLNRACEGDQVSLTDKNGMAFTGLFLDCGDEKNAALTLQNVMMVQPISYQPLKAGPQEFYDRMKFNLSAIVDLRKKPARGAGGKLQD